MDNTSRPYRHATRTRTTVIPLPDVDEVDLRWLMTPEAPDIEELLTELYHRPTWHAQAACRGMGTDAFFPSVGESTAAKAVCEGCEIRRECHETALSDPATHVIWGGLSARSRRMLRRGAA